MALSYRRGGAEWGKGKIHFQSQLSDVVTATAALLGPMVNPG